MLKYKLKLKVINRINVRYLWVVIMEVREKLKYVYISGSYRNFFIL